MGTAGVASVTAPEFESLRITRDMLPLLSQRGLRIRVGKFRTRTLFASDTSYAGRHQARYFEDGRSASTSLGQGAGSSGNGALVARHHTLRPLARPLVVLRLRGDVRLQRRQQFCIRLVARRRTDVGQEPAANLA